MVLILPILTQIPQYPYLYPNLERGGRAVVFRLAHTDRHMPRPEKSVFLLDKIHQKLLSL